MSNTVNSNYPKYPISKTSDIIKSGEVFSIDNNTVILNKHASFSCRLNGELGDGILKVGHGIGCYSAAHIEVSATHLKVFHHYAQTAVSAEFEHGLKISDYITVNIDVGFSRAVITVASSGGVYRAENVAWAGRQGVVYASPIGIDVTDVKFNWLCDGYAKDIWLFGDSYFNTEDGHRWPHYMKKDGFANHFMTGYPGMGSKRAIIDFKLALTRGKPKYAVWCMGMNNGDRDRVINKDYLDTTTEFLELCRFNGITPILSTIPTTPTVDNRYKNEWVRSQEVRYIDFARAVGGEKPTEGTLGKKYTLPTGAEATNVTGFEWYPGMLYPDLVHPDIAGANALYVQVLADFPEIMLK